ncbi:putative DNA (cytosine-5-)-methyltransferase [Dioscorea sansibarensis]
MGCCVSFLHPNSGNDDHQDAPGTNVNPPHNLLLLPPSQPFRPYSLVELTVATDGFSSRNLLSRGGGQLPNIVYRGRLRGGQQIAVKRFSVAAWPDVVLFREESIKAGKLRHRRLASLIGYCCDGNARLLVAEFCCNGDSLARHLFDRMFCSPSFIVVS